MSTIVTRQGKGSELTWDEMDANLNNLNNDKVELTNLASTDTNKGTDLIGITGQTGKTVSDLFDGGYDLTIKSQDIITKGPWVDVRAFGAKGDGVTDDTTAIQAAIDSLINGGLVLFHSGTFLISSTITLQTDNIILIGQGPLAHHDVSGGTFGTRILWNGTAENMIYITSPISSTGPKSFGCGLIGLYLHGNNTATKGILIASHNHGIMDRCTIHAMTSVCLELSCLTNGSLGEAHDTQKWNIKNILIKAGYNTFDGDNAEGIKLTGTSTANASFNVFENIDIFHTNSIGLNLDNCDNNLFKSIRTIRAAAATGSNNSLVFGGGSTIFEVARANLIFHFSGKEIYAEGTSTKTAASYNNYVLFDRENSGSIPTIDTGASLKWENENAPSQDNIIYHTNGYVECWGTSTISPAASASVTLPITYTTTDGMSIQVTANTGYISSGLSTVNAFIINANKIGLANSDQATAQSVFWRSIGKKTN